MDLGNPWGLFSGLVVGAIGFVVFVYGKRQAEPRCLLTGAVLCVYPYFVESVAWMWVVAAACLGVLYAWTRWV
jgi:hypothetical protein